MSRSEPDIATLLVPPDGAPAPLPPGGERQSPHERAHLTRGVGYAVAAYLAWGLAPIYFKALPGVPALEILCHRIVWSVVFLIALTVLDRGWPRLRAAFTSRRAMRTLGITTLLIGTNWFLFIWAVANNHLLQASLGYYINPLVNVALGLAFLHERLSRYRAVALALAGAGVVVLVWRQIAVEHTLPWLALVLPLSFGLYSLLRKRAATDALTGLSVETALLMPFALAYLLWLWRAGEGHFGAPPIRISVLLSLAGVITTTPLLWYNIAARRVQLSTMGFLQYIAPTGQFLLGVLVYKETFTPVHALAFALIWSALIVCSIESAVSYRRAKR